MQNQTLAPYSLSRLCLSTPRRRPLCLSRRTNEEEEEEYVSFARSSPFLRLASLSHLTRQIQVCLGFLFIFFWVSIYDFAFFFIIHELLGFSFSRITDLLPLHSRMGSVCLCFWKRPHPLPFPCFPDFLSFVACLAFPFPSFIETWENKLNDA